ncbi:cupin domain-containing protein [Micromonospora sp. DT81.3]|uniref:cupin domain-containing protein n=1 Tax=Actinomycetes TaxID=1760 RepID=UPI003CE73EF0
MNTKRRITSAIAVAALICTTGLASAAMATPGSGNLVQSDVASGILDETANGPTKVSQDGIQLKTKDETTVTTFDLTYPAGSFSGWHSHPGIVIVVVKSGTVVRQTGCDAGEMFGVNQSFTEVGPHYVSNPGTEPAVLSITRIFPSSETVARHDEPAPLCP